MQAGLLRRLVRDEAGNTLAIFAAALIPMALMIGSGLDLGVMYAGFAARQGMTGVT